MEQQIQYTDFGIPILSVVGIMYCDNCGTKIENTKEWQEKHKEECE